MSCVLAQKCTECRFEIFASWNLISSLCSLNDPVLFFLLFWIPDPPVEPAETLSRRLSWNTLRYSCPFSPHSSSSIGYSYSFKLLPPLVFPHLLASSFLLSSAVHFLTADKWSALMITGRYSTSSQPTVRWREGVEWGKEQLTCFYFIRILLFFNETQKRQ